MAAHDPGRIEDVLTDVVHVHALGGRLEQHIGRVGTNISLFGGAFVNTFAIQGMQLQRDFSTGTWFDGERVKGEYRGVLSFSAMPTTIGIAPR